MRVAALVLALTLGVASSTPSVAATRPAHHAVRARPAPPPAATSRLFVAAANPLAAQAGMAALKRGGSAVDAAVAIQSVLGLVEPQSSGLGGGAFLMFYEAKTGKVTAYDGRETAPAGATPDMFLDPQGGPLPFAEAVVSGRATGVPGAVALLGLAHKEHGRLAWPSLFEDGVRLADRGFTVSPRLGRFIAGNAPQNARPDVRAYFTRPDGAPLRAGDTLKNPAYAATLRRLAAEGAGALYRGPIAEAITAKVHEGPLPGTMTLADLKAYRPVERQALCRPWRIWTVCVPPPPSSGVALLQALAILEHTDIDRRGPQDPKGWFEFAEASRLMYADRDRYVADPAFVSVPVAGLLDPTYVASRAALIGERAGPPPAAGTPPGVGARAPDRTVEPAGTTHFVVVDGEGNAVSMTTTVESLFGTGRMVEGFFLNNQLTDFSFSPAERSGVPIANAVAPGKRPRSSMSPVIVLDRKGRFVAALGSPGGNAILAYNLKALIGAFDWNLSMQAAIDLPNLIARGSNYFGEPDKFAPQTLAGLAALGVVVRPGQGEDSGLHGVRLVDGRFDGGADPRREGVGLSYPPPPGQGDHAKHGGGG
jgi:gamma-glutamyltranspeptidase/glutathione hydrolase